MDILSTPRDIRCERCGSLIVPAGRASGLEGDAVVRAVLGHYLSAGHLPAQRRNEDLAVAG